MSININVDLGVVTHCYDAMWNGRVAEKKSVNEKVNSGD